MSIEDHRRNIRMVRMRAAKEAGMEYGVFPTDEQVENFRRIVREKLRQMREDEIPSSRYTLDRLPKSNAIRDDTDQGAFSVAVGSTSLATESPPRSRGRIPVTVEKYSVEREGPAKVTLRID